MSSVAISHTTLASINGEDREAKLRAAKEKLRKYRSAQTSSSSSLNAGSSAPSCHSPAGAGIRPLSTNLISNIVNDCEPKEGKMYGHEADLANKPISGGAGHARQGSMSARHRRNGSTARSQGGFAPAGWSMSNAASVPSASLYPAIPSEIITTPATPQIASSELSPDPFAGPPLPPVSSGEEDVQAARQRFTSFSFRAKAPQQASPLASPIASPARTRARLSSFPSQQGVSGLFSSASPPSEVSSTPSRPPSLLFTAPTPLPSTCNEPDRPSTPPKERRKRHSHTRSSSISMPNLRLGRPTSLVIPAIPSYPSSPSSPINDINSAPRPVSAGSHLTFGQPLVAGQPQRASKLKFEPSEAEKEQEEGRRRALEKLTGSSPLASPLMDEPHAAISLPSDEDEEVRPLSGIFASPTFSFGRPNSLNLPSLSSSISSSTSSTSPFSWSAGEDVIPERWSFGQPKEEIYTLDMPKRASQTGTLAVLAEEDEAAAEEEEANNKDSRRETIRSFSGPSDVPTDVALEDPTVSSPSGHRPTPSRLRELHLVTSVSSSTPSKPDSPCTTRPTSPTKLQGVGGRTRPRPLSGNMKSSASVASATPPASALITPTGSTRTQRRQSRGSSIGYMKDGSTSSSASVPYPVSRWSISSRDIISPPPDVLAKSATSRPRPRPTSTAESIGALRVLSNVSEKDEASVTAGEEAWRLEALQRPETYTFQSFSSGPSSDRRASHESTGEEAAWREEILEMRMERDTLKEDVQGWKDRCSSAENKLEEEKRNNGVLRERVRKLGDWLLNVPGSSPTPSAAGSAENSRALRELQEQLFATTTSLEQERREKEQAVARVVELEREMSKLRFETRAYVQTVDSTSAPDSPFVATAAATPTRSPFISPAPSGNNTPAASTPDTNDQRMRAWGFPRGPIMGKKENKRESFFGLSRDVRGSPLGSMSVQRDQLEEGSGAMGVDLPPVACVGVVSAPNVLVESPETAGSDDGIHGQPRVNKRALASRWIDASSSISAGTAPITPYEARTSMPTEHNKPEAVDQRPAPSPPRGERPLTAVSRVYEPPWKANQSSGSIPWYARGSSGMAPVMGVGLDLRAVCRCCRGEVLEV